MQSLHKLFLKNHIATHSSYGEVSNQIYESVKATDVCCRTKITNYMYWLRSSFSSKTALSELEVDIDIVPLANGFFSVFLLISKPILLSLKGLNVNFLLSVDTNSLSFSTEMLAVFAEAMALLLGPFSTTKFTFAPPGLLSASPLSSFRGLLGALSAPPSDKQL